MTTCKHGLQHDISHLLSKFLNKTMNIITPLLLVYQDGNQEGDAWAMSTMNRGT